MWEVTYFFIHIAYSHTTVLIRTSLNSNAEKMSEADVAGRLEQTHLTHLRIPFGCQPYQVLPAIDIREGSYHHSHMPED